MSIAERAVGRSGGELGSTERMLSMAGGSLLLVSGVMSPSQLRSLALSSSGLYLIYRAATGVCPVSQALGLREYRPNVAVPNKRGVHFVESITINASPQQIFDFWRDLPRLPQIIEHLHSVTASSDKNSHWEAETPVKTRLQWDAEIIDERPAEFLAWRSLPGGDIDSAGSIHLKSLPHGRGTEVRLVMKYDPPGGKVTAKLAEWFGLDVEAHLKQALRRMKQTLETGETPTTQGQPTGTHQFSSAGTAR